MSCQRDVTIFEICLWVEHVENSAVMATPIRHFTKHCISPHMCKKRMSTCFLLSCKMQYLFNMRNSTNTQHNTATRISCSFMCMLITVFKGEFVINYLKTTKPSQWWRDVKMIAGMTSATGGDDIRSHLHLDGITTHCNQDIANYSNRCRVMPRLRVSPYLRMTLRS